MQPLPGPGGLFTVTAMPRFHLDSSRVGWSGAHFVDLDCAPAGHVQHLHEHYSLQRILQPFRARRHGTQTWRPVLPGSALWRPEDDQLFEWDGAGGRQFLTLASRRVQEVLDGRTPRFVVPSPFESLASPLVARVMDALRFDLQDGSPAGPLVGDALLTALIAHLAAASPLRGAGQLAAFARERVVEYVTVHLARPIALDELASVAGLGIRQFCRAFRSSLGTSPHQYLLQQRVERAKTLIGSGMPLSDIAVECGFGDQSSLARTFSRHTGHTPSEFRASLHGSVRIRTK